MAKKKIMPTSKLRRPPETMTYDECQIELEREFADTEGLQDPRALVLGKRMIGLVSHGSHDLYSWICYGGEAKSGIGYDAMLDRAVFYKMAHHELNASGSRVVKNYKKYAYRDPDAFDVQYDNDMQVRWARGALYQNALHDALVSAWVEEFIIPAMYESKSRPYYQVQQYVQAHTMLDWFRGSSRKHRAEFMLALVAAVNFLHDHGNETGGVVHRDLKPANILITKEGLPVITDWGLAKIRGDTNLTRPGTGRGSMKFSSHDQLVNAVDASYHNDAYSIAIMFYVMTTGKEPVVASENDLILKAVRAKYHRDLLREIPNQLHHIFCKATDFDIHHRYATLSPMYDDMHNAFVSMGLVEKSSDRDITASYIDKKINIHDLSSVDIPTFQNAYINQMCAACEDKDCCDIGICRAMVNRIIDVTLAMKEKGLL